MSERFALYYAPATDAPLWRLASDWLGHDAATGASGRQQAPAFDLTHLDAVTGSPRRYGFHATLKAPMVLADGVDATALDMALTEFAAAHAPVAVGPVEIRSLDGFLAIVPQQQTQGLTDFAFGVVQAFDALRAPLEDKDRARRQASGMSPRQAELLEAHGYPYVAEQFRFHMTLTDRLAADDLTPVLAAAQHWFAPALVEPLVVDRLVLFHQADAEAAFTRLSDFPLSA